MPSLNPDTVPPSTTTSVMSPSRRTPTRVTDRSQNGLEIVWPARWKTTPLAVIRTPLVFVAHDRLPVSTYSSPGMLSS
jgi:hypothetical protein